MSPAAERIVGLVCLYFSFSCFLFIGLVIFWVLCCGGGSEEEETVVIPDRTAAQLAAYAAPAMVEMWPPVSLARAAAARRPPVAPAVKLGYFPYSMEGRRASEKLVCAICVEMFVQGDVCSEVPACRHVFHRDCIDKWMKSKTTCPLCRVKC